MKKIFQTIFVLVLVITIPSQIFADGIKNSNDYEKIANHYFPELSDSKLLEIIEYIPIAESLINKNIEYDNNWSNSERKNIALAISIYLETERGEQPAKFKSQGELFKYNKDAKDINEYWTKNYRSDLAATIQIFVPLYFEKETNLLVIYHDGEWIHCKNSDRYDYQSYIDYSNMFRGYIQFDTAREGLGRLTAERKWGISHIPVIALDENITDLEKFPISFSYSGGISLSPRIDLVLPINDCFGVLGKLVGKSGYQYIPESNLGWKYEAELGNMTQYFNDAYKLGHTYFIGVGPDHEDELDSQIYATEIVENYASTDNLINRDEYEILETLLNSSFLSIYNFTIYDPNKTERNREIFEYPIVE